MDAAGVLERAKATTQGVHASSVFRAQKRNWTQEVHGLAGVSGVSIGGKTELKTAGSTAWTVEVGRTGGSDSGTAGAGVPL